MSASRRPQGRTYTCLSRTWLDRSQMGSAALELEGAATQGCRDVHDGHFDRRFTAKAAWVAFKRLCSSLQDERSTRRPSL
jgi:hypothetical protein